VWLQIALSRALSFSDCALVTTIHYSTFNSIKRLHQSSSVVRAMQCVAPLLPPLTTFQC
jgi:hypothetical protein